MYRRLVACLANQLVRALDLELDERWGLQNHSFVRIGVIAQLVSRRDYFSPLFGIAFEVNADDKERRFNACFVQDRKNLFGHPGNRAVVESQGDDLLPRVYARNDLPEELKRSGLADLKCGGSHHYDRGDEYQGRLPPFIEHLFYIRMNQRRGRWRACLHQQAYWSRPRSPPPAVLIRG